MFGALVISLTLVIALALEGDLEAAAASARRPLSLPPASKAVSTLSSGVRLIHTSCLNRLTTSKMIDRWTMKG